MSVLASSREDADAAYISLTKISQLCQLGCLGEAVGLTQALEELDRVKSRGGNGSHQFRILQRKLLSLHTASKLNMRSRVLMSSSPLSSEDQVHLRLITLK